jgi:rubrerythrin
MEETDIINGCIKVENSAASIYSNMIEVFPQHKEFWGSLLNDEREHIAFLTDVKSQGLVTEMEKIDLPPSMKVIQENLRIIEKVSRRVSDNPINMKNALKLALKVEDAMVEIYTVELIAKLLSCEGEEYYEKVIDDEKTHVGKIRKMMKKAN